MRSVFDTPWDSQPQEVEEVNWDHPFFAKATKAWVFVGSQPYSWGKHAARYALTNYSGTATTRVVKGFGRGPESATTGVNHIAPVLQELSSALVISYAATLTEGSTNYVGHRLLQPGFVSFGTGGTAGGSSRRDWDWTQGNANSAYCVVPNTNMANAPAVHVAGNKVVVTANASPGTGAVYGWGGSTTYFNAWPSGLACGLLVVVNGQVTDADAALATAAPWEIFRPRRIWVPVSAGGGVTSTALSGAGAAVGTLVGAETTAATLSATGAAVGTLVTATTLTADLSSTAAAVGTLEAVAIEGGAAATDLSTAGAAIGTLVTATTITAVLSSTAAAVGTLEAVAIDGSAPTDLSATGAATATGATASIIGSDLSAAGAAVGTLGALAISGYETADLSAAGAAVGTMAGAAIIGATLSAAGAAVATGYTLTASTDNAYLTWGAQARRVRQLQEEDDEEILQMLATMLPLIKRGSNGKSYSRSAVRRNR